MNHTMQSHSIIAPSLTPARTELQAVPNNQSVGAIFSSDKVRASLAFEELRTNVSSLTDDEVINIANRAGEIEWRAFMLRGLCAEELRRRHPARLSGGRGKKDDEGIGLLAKLKCLADNLKISVKTLTTDAKIYRTFFADNETMLEHENSLARDYYVKALSAIDPHSAIKVARRLLGEGEFSSAQLGRYVREINALVQERPLPESSKRRKAHGESQLLKVRVSIDALEMLEQTIDISKCTIDKQVENAIIQYCENLLRPEKEDEFYVPEFKPRRVKQPDDQSKNIPVITPHDTLTEHPKLTFIP